MEFYLFLEAKDFIFAAFIGLSAWFSYKLGWKSGLSDGIDKSLFYLSDQGFIELEELPDGELKISKAE